MPDTQALNTPRHAHPVIRRDAPVTILCSGVALGVYIPGMLVRYQLERRGAAADVVVLENLLLPEKRARLPESKKAFHRSFRLALAGQKMAADLLPSCDPRALEELFRRWHQDRRRDFLVFSGFWVPILRRYMAAFPGARPDVEVVHMDADVSASWRLFREESERFTNTWLFDGRQGKVPLTLHVTDRQPVPFAERPLRCVTHGGGWGMGTYREKLQELERCGMALDIVAYEPSEATALGPDQRCFMVDPAWFPWLKNPRDEHEFPRFAEIRAGSSPLFRNRAEHHELFDVIRTSRAIVSKPGGATLIDSLAAATPLVMLEPFGDYEQKNADLWRRLGFGIGYPEWVASGFSQELLAALHRNLLRARPGIGDFVTDYLRRTRARPDAAC